MQYIVCLSVAFLFCQLLTATGQEITQQCLDCICEASTGCDLSKQCLNTGGDGYFCGPYQISWAYWSDGGRPGNAGGPHDFENCLKNKQCAEQAVIGYMRQWKTDCNQDGVIDCLDFAAIHKTGPAQCNSHNLWNSEYWHRFANTRCYTGTGYPSQPVNTGGIPARLPPTPNRPAPPRIPARPPNNPYAFPNGQPANVPEVNNNGRVFGIPNLDSIYAPRPIGGNQPQPQPDLTLTRPLNWTVFTAEAYNRYRPTITTTNNNPNPNNNLRPLASPAPVAPASPSAPSGSRNTMVINSNEPVSDNCLFCICQASSKCNLTTQCDGNFCGPYLISWAYWSDGGQPGGDFVSCALNKNCAERAIQGYMSKWSRDCNQDGVIDCDDFARIHKFGPGSCNSKTPDNNYWRQYSSCSGPSFNEPTGNMDNVYFRPSIEEVQPSNPNVPPRPTLVPPSSNPNVPSVRPALPPRSTAAPPPPLSPSTRPSTAVTLPILSTSPPPPLSSTANRVSEYPVYERPVYVREESLSPVSSGREPPPRPPVRNPAPVVEIPLDEAGPLDFPGGDSSGLVAPSDRDVSDSYLDASYARERSSRRLPLLPDTNGRSFSTSNLIRDRRFHIPTECMDCICEASSSCDNSVQCSNDFGTEKQCGPYQISYSYWRQAGQPGYQGIGSDFESCASDKDCAETAVRAFVGKSIKDCNGDGVIDCLDYAVIHKFGPGSCTTSAQFQNTQYWKDFQQCYGFVAT